MRVDCGDNQLIVAENKFLVTVNYQNANRIIFSLYEEQLRYGFLHSM